MDSRATRIIDFIKKNREVSSKEIHDSVAESMSYATVKRVIAKLTDEHLIAKKGVGKSTKYVLSPTYEIIYPIDVNAYFEKEIDERSIKERFDLHLISESLNSCALFTSDELERLNALQKKFT
jgi:predicted transcriptional regulator